MSKSKKTSLPTQEDVTAILLAGNATERAYLYLTNVIAAEKLGGGFLTASQLKELRDLINSTSGTINQYRYAERRFRVRDYIIGKVWQAMYDVLDEIRVITFLLALKHQSDQMADAINMALAIGGIAVPSSIPEREFRKNALDLIKQQVEFYGATAKIDKDGWLIADTAEADKKGESLDEYIDYYCRLYERDVRKYLAVSMGAKRALTRSINPLNSAFILAIGKSLYRLRSAARLSFTFCYRESVEDAKDRLGYYPAVSPRLEHIYSGVDKVSFGYEPDSNLVSAYASEFSDLITKTR